MALRRPRPRDLQGGGGGCPAHRQRAVRASIQCGGQRADETIPRPGGVHRRHPEGWDEQRLCARRQPFCPFGPPRHDCINLWHPVEGCAQLGRLARVHHKHGHLWQYGAHRLDLKRRGRIDRPQTPGACKARRVDLCRGFVLQQKRVRRRGPGKRRLDADPGGAVVGTGKGDDHVLCLRVDIDDGMPRRILAHGHMRNIDAILHQQIQHPTAFRANRADVTCLRPGPGGCDGLVPPPLPPSPMLY